MSVTEQRPFQADIKELLNLIIHAFYSNRDVFLREAISNASDAIDKQRVLDLSENRLNKEYAIYLEADKENRRLSIRDNGVGMSESQLIEHLSTIARSGTKEFMKQLNEKSDQIGQFGVGFYSLFLVADRVDVYSRQLNATETLKWSSDANEFYTIETNNEKDAILGEHGTLIFLHLKEDAVDYLEESTIRRIVSTHSSFITYPIQLFVTKEVEQEEEGKTEEEEEEIEEEEGKVVVEEGEEKKEETPTKKTITVQEWEVINGDKPIWYNRASDVTNEQYETLYKTISKDYDAPLFWRHFQTEGAYEFRGILFVPKRAPFDMLGDRNREKRRIRLYVKKVLVLQELDKEMMPDWMNFVVGVIDSADLPLNVSREMLQQTKVLQAMKSQLKKQVMNMLQDLLSSEHYNTFYENFQRNIKLGIHEGDQSLLDYLKVPVNEETDEITLADYVNKYRKDDEQKDIYFATGSEVKDNSMVRLYRNKGYSVLMFEQAIDEFMLQRISKYKDYDLVNIIKEHKAPWEAEEETDQEEIKKFCEYIKDIVSDSSLETVRPSKTLTSDSNDPGYIFSSKFGWTGNMEKIMSSQPLNDAKNMMWMKGKRILELNMNHPLVQEFRSHHDDEDLRKMDTEKIKLFYRCCLLSAGFPLDNQTEFVNQILTTLSPSTAVQ